MSNNTLASKKIPINRLPREELIQDAQSAIDAGLNSFETQGQLADRSFMSNEPELRNPNEQQVQDISMQSKDQLFADQPVVDNLETTVDNTSTVEQEQPIVKKETNKDFNMRIMRERAEAAEAKARRLENMYQQEQQKPQYYQEPIRQQQEPEFSLDIDDSALLEGKDVKRVVNQLRQEYKREMQQIKLETQAASAVNQLKTKYNDYQQIVNEETIKNFRTIYPEEFQSVVSNPDVYGQGKSLYTMIKTLGLAENEAPVTSAPVYSQTNRIAENMKRPRTAARVGTQGDNSTLGKLNEYANGRRVLSESDKAKVREKLQHSRTYSY